MVSIADANRRFQPHIKTAVTSQHTPTTPKTHKYEHGVHNTQCQEDTGHTGGRTGGMGCNAGHPPRVREVCNPLVSTIRLPGLGEVTAEHSTRQERQTGGWRLQIEPVLENEVSRETRGGRAPAGPLGPAQQHTTLGVNSRWARTGWGRREAPRRCCRNVEWRARTPVCRTLGPGRRPCTLDTGHCTAQGVGEGQVEAWVPQKSHAFPEGSDGRVGERYTHAPAPGLGQ